MGNLLIIKPLPLVAIEAPGLGALAVRAEAVLLGGHDVRQPSSQNVTTSGGHYVRMSRRQEA